MNPLYRNILILSVFFLTACEKEFTSTNVGEDILIPTYGYINFNAEIPSTRATLITDMKRNFGVMGYSWDYNNQNDIWNTVKVQAKPNVFYNQQVTYDAASQIHSYDAYPDDNSKSLISWNTGDKYTFFGYYPYSTEANGLITVSSNNTEGTPYLTYTQPDGIDAMLDVMTASIYNTDYKSSREVNLHFRHRLAAINVQMVNMNASLSNGTEVYIKVSDLKINLTNLKYSKAEIWMDQDLGFKSQTEAANKSKTYPIGSTFNIEPSTLAGINIAVSDTLTVIPQEDNNLQGNISFKLDYVDKGGKSLNNNKELKDAQVTPGNHNHTIDFGQAILEGRIYFIQLTFTRDAVTVQSIQPGEWVDKNIPTHFE